MLREKVGPLCFVEGGWWEGVGSPDAQYATSTGRNLAPPCSEFRMKTAKGHQQKKFDLDLYGLW